MYHALLRRLFNKYLCCCSTSLPILPPLKLWMIPLTLTVLFHLYSFLVKCLASHTYPIQTCHLLLNIAPWLLHAKNLRLKFLSEDYRQLWLTNQPLHISFVFPLVILYMYIVKRINVGLDSILFARWERNRFLWIFVNVLVPVISIFPPLNRHIFPPSVIFFTLKLPLPRSLPQPLLVPKFLQPLFLRVVLIMQPLFLYNHQFLTDIYSLYHICSSSNSTISME